MNRPTFKIDKLEPDLYAFTAPMEEQIYLLLGNKEAVLIDTGMGIGSLANEVRKITNLPIVVIDTHGHPDHAGGNGEFSEVWLDQKDEKVYEEMVSEEYRTNDIRKIFKHPVPEFENELIPFLPQTRPLLNDQIFDLGNHRLRIIETPGHTPGSVCVYYSVAQILFSGDTVSATDQWLYLKHSTSLETYALSLKKLLDLQIKYLLPGHLPRPVDPKMILNKMELSMRVISGEISGKEVKTFAGQGYIATKGDASIIYDPKKIKGCDL